MSETSPYVSPAKTILDICASAILTWREGYPASLDQAESLVKNNVYPLFIKLASQNSPNDAFSKHIYARGWKLLSVSNRFADVDLNTNDPFFIIAVRKAIAQYDEGFPDWMPHVHRESNAEKRSESLIEPPVPVLLSESQTAELLQMVYANLDDDGVR